MSILNSNSFLHLFTSFLPFVHSAIYQLKALVGHITEHSRTLIILHLLKLSKIINFVFKVLLEIIKYAPCSAEVDLVVNKVRLRNGA